MSYDEIPSSNINPDTRKFQYLFSFMSSRQVRAGTKEIKIKDLLTGQDKLLIN